MWIYTLDNDQCRRAGAQCRRTLTDSFTATTIDGTSQLVTITIERHQRHTGRADDFANLIPLVRSGGGPPPELQGAVSVLSNDSTLTPVRPSCCA